MKSIDKIGVELEGSWNGERGVPPFEDTDIHHDGSVKVAGGCTHWGELNSPAFEALEEMISWVRVHHPHATNKTCGFHIHLSLKRKLDYSRLMSTAFQRFFQKNISKWARKNLPKDDFFWERFEGKNKYCKAQFLPDHQVNAGHGNVRYSQLNFCFMEHGTLEVRLFPMWSNVETSVSALKTYVEMVEEFLKHVKRSQYKGEWKYLSLKVKDLGLCAK